MNESSLTITQKAAGRVRKLIESEGNEALMFRVAVNGGGCSGFQYSFSLDENTTDEDVVIPAHGVNVVVDEVSLDLLAGSTVDFVEDLIGASFQITNPNADSTCGCGMSFSA